MSEAKPAGHVDDIILRYADSHSPEEIAQKLGGIVTPAAVAARGKVLLKSTNWLESVEQEQLTLLKLRRLLSRLEEKHLDLDNAKIQHGLLKTIAERLEKRSQRNTQDLNVLYANQGRIMAQAFDIALSYMKSALRDSIDAGEWDELQREALEHARAELEKYEVKEIEA